MLLATRHQSQTRFDLRLADWVSIGRKTYRIIERYQVHQHVLFQLLCRSKTCLHKDYKSGWRSRKISKASECKEVNSSSWCLKYSWSQVHRFANPYKKLNYFQFVSNISTLTYSKSIRLFLTWNMHKTTLYSAYSFLWNQHLIRLYRIKIVAARKISKNMASPYFFIFKFWNLFPQSK